MRPALTFFLCLAGCGGAEPARRETPPEPPASGAAVAEPDDVAAPAVAEPPDAPALSLVQLDHLVDATDLDHVLADLGGMGVRTECTDGDYAPVDAHLESRDCAPAEIRLDDVDALLVVVRRRAIADPASTAGIRIELRAPRGSDGGWLAAVERALTPAVSEDPLAPEVRALDLEEGGRQLRVGDRVTTLLPAADDRPAVVHLTHPRRALPH